jgi:hypothetical protein
MDDKTKAELLEAGSKVTSQFAAELLAMLRAAKDFSVEQAPLVVKELLGWAAVSAGIWLIVALALFAFGVLLFKRTNLARKAWKPQHAYEMNPWEPAVVLSATLFTTGLSVSVWALREIAYVTVAPRVYLIEYLSDLVK